MSRPFPIDGRRWMRENATWISDNYLKDVWLPGSHDAGMVTGLCSPAMLEGELATQTLSIYEQLLCGVRWFDIRPACLNGTSRDGKAVGDQWFCGHHSKIAGQWLGGLGTSIKSVIEQVNRFTEDNKELVVLSLTHIVAHDNNGGIDNFEDRTRELLDYIFSNLKDVYRPLQPTPDASASPQEITSYRLNQFAGNPQCVIVSTWGDEGRDGPLIRDQTWKQLGIIQTNFRFQQNSVKTTIEQTSSDVFWRRSIVKLSEQFQNVYLWVWPQMLATEKRGGVLAIDINRDDAALNICLAGTRARWLAMADKSEAVVAYGGRLIWAPSVTGDMNVFGRVVRESNNTKPGPTGIMINNARMGVDPAPNLLKSCAVFIGQKRFPGKEPFYTGRFAREGSEVDLTSDILDINWGGEQLDDLAFRKGYMGIWEGLQAQVPFIPGNEQFDGRDPMPGKRKDLLFKYFTRYGRGLRQRRLRDQVQTNMSREIQVFLYGGAIPPAQASENIYWRLDGFETGPHLISNVTMGPGNGQSFDPTPNIPKAVYLKCQALDSDQKLFTREAGAREGEYLKVPDMS